MFKTLGARTRSDEKRQGSARVDRREATNAPPTPSSSATARWIVDTVAKSLKKYAMTPAPITADLDQSQRQNPRRVPQMAICAFLVASDVAARAPLIVPAVSHVYNFDVPSHARRLLFAPHWPTGRAGRDGKAIMSCVYHVMKRNLEDVETSGTAGEIPRLGKNPLGWTRSPKLTPDRRQDEPSVPLLNRRWIRADNPADPFRASRQEA